MESAYYAEVIDPASGKSASAGATGELVLTTLGRVGSPLLRYRTGDVVKLAAPAPGHPAGPCRCGRYEMALEGGILGRTDDMVVVRGVNVYPSAVEEIVRGCGGVAEYRVEITSRGVLAELQLEIEAEPGQAQPERLVRELEASFDSALALRIPIKLVPSGSLPRFELKANRWVRIEGAEKARRALGLPME
jgi:phenylacetate-CoA ligase